MVIRSRKWGEFWPTLAQLGLSLSLRPASACLGCRFFPGELGSFLRDIGCLAEIGRRSLNDHMPRGVNGNASVRACQALGSHSSVPLVSTSTETGSAADRVGQLDFALVSEPGCDDVLGDVAGHVRPSDPPLSDPCRRTRRPVAVAAVGITMILAVGPVCIGADHETTGQVDAVPRWSGYKSPFGAAGLMTASMMSRSICLLVTSGAMWSDDHRSLGFRSCIPRSPETCRLGGPTAVLLSHFRQALGRAMTIGIGINSVVSLVAWPNIKPWSPAPPSPHPAISPDC